MAFLNFESANGQITCEGAPIRLKGINWFGMETNVFAPHGLWAVSFDSVFQVIKDNKFNALRIPLSVEGVEKMEIQTVQSINSAANPKWANLTMATFLDRLIARCGEAGILVMLDMHLLEASSPIPELWYDSEYDEKRLIHAWKILLARFQRHWNFFACDLKNEPHGKATWGDGSPTDWRAAAERIGNAILAVCPRMLIFVEGIEGSDDSWWGGYLGLAMQAPVRLSNPLRLVYSPHVYGPDVYFKESFKAPDFPDNLMPVWRRHWAFLKLDKAGPAVVLGEWGGKAKQGTLDLTWQRAMAEYLGYYGFGSFYWCVNPNSGDTGGILGKDWTTPNYDKLELIRVACPAPTSFAGGRPDTPPRPAISLPWNQILPLGPDTLPAQMTDPGASSTGQPPKKTDHKKTTPPKVPTVPTVDEPAKPNGTHKPPTKPPTPTKPITPPKPPTPNPSVVLTSRKNHSWKGEAGEVTQWDVSLTNNTGVPLKSTLRFVVQGCEVVNIWNMALMAPNQYKLPAWLSSSGGLQPRASHTFGLITHKGAPKFTVNSSKE